MNTDQISDQPHAMQQVAPNWFRGFLQGKTRIVLAWIFAGVLLFSAREYPTWPGIAVCFAGASLRMWASGFLRKDARPAVGGPYAWCRNPLYLGTYLMAVGIALAIQAWPLLAFVTVLYVVVYHYIILDEETKLQKIFGDSYRVYCELVPRFFPFPPSGHFRARIGEINPEPSHRVYDWTLARRNKWWEPHLSFAALVLLVTIVAIAWRQF